MAGAPPRSFARCHFARWLGSSAGLLTHRLWSYRGISWPGGAPEPGAERFVGPGLFHAPSAVGRGGIAVERGPVRSGWDLDHATELKRPVGGFDQVGDAATKRQPAVRGAQPAAQHADPLPLLVGGEWFMRDDADDGRILALDRKRQEIPCGRCGCPGGIAGRDAPAAQCGRCEDETIRLVRHLDVVAHAETIGAAPMTDQAEVP